MESVYDQLRKEESRADGHGKSAELKGKER